MSLNFRNGVKSVARIVFVQIAEEIAAYVVADSPSSIRRLGTVPAMVRAATLGRIIIGPANENLLRRKGLTLDHTLVSGRGSRVLNSTLASVHDSRVVVDGGASRLSLP